MVLLSLLACPTSRPDPEPSWFMTCGDPACGGYSGPFEGVPLCDTESIGAACGDEGATCDPEDSCNALLICATSDPTHETGGCPISRARFKRDIRYASPAELDGVGRSALAMPLAWWNYRGEPATRLPHFGFVIDDLDGGPAVTPDGDHVDLYGYTSLVLAAVQAQDRRIAALEARLAEQGAEIVALKAAATGPVTVAP